MRHEARGTTTKYAAAQLTEAAGLPFLPFLRLRWRGCPFDCFSLRGHRARARLPSLARSSAPLPGPAEEGSEKKTLTQSEDVKFLSFEKRRDITFPFIFIFRLLIGLNRGGVKVRPRSWLEGHAGSRGHAVVGRVLVLADWESRSHRSGTARAHGFSNVFHLAFDWRCDRRCDERRQ